MPKEELKNIMGVEIFSAGTWNGDKYTVNDLDEMVRAFEFTRAGFSPPLKLGHDDEQKILQNDGYPAAGWIGKVYRVGEKLLADFVDIPNKIYEILEKGAYKKVSSEIYWGVDVNGTKFDRMLAGVALLGADMPAVTNLSDILAMYADRFNLKKVYTNDKDQINIKTYSFDSMDEEEEAEEMPQDNKELELKISAQEEKLNAQDAELAALKKYKEDTEASIKKIQEDAAASRLAAENARLDASVTELQANKVISPAMKNYVKAFLGEDKKEYSFGEKKLDKLDLLKSILSLHSEALKLNTKETTVEGEEQKQSVELGEKIAKYSKDKNVSYGEAYKIVMREERAKEGGK